MSNSVEALTHSLRVLVVAEGQHIRKLVRGLLVNVGVRKIEEACDGLAGLESIKAFDPDVVILDWDLPLLSGPEMARIIRAPGAAANRGVPIIMVAASASRQRVAEAKQLNVDTFLVLPISAKTLLDRILSALASARRNPDSQRAQDQSSAPPDPVVRI